jgi:TolB-like protein/DNA-binding winged helix-turn-helix (wHTH) protein/Tfp pilus assembly protein PilF
MSEQNRQIYGFDNFRLDVPNRRLLRDGAPVSLQARAFDVLVVLIENGGRLIGKDELFSRVWPDLIVEESNLTVQVSAIRRALGDNKDNPHYIITVPGHGYRFISNVLLLNESEDDEELVIEHHSRSRIVVETETERGAAPGGSVDLANVPELRSAMVSAGSSRASTSVTGQNGDLTGRSTSSAEYLVGEIKRHRRGGAIALVFLIMAIGATAYFYYSARGNKTEVHSIAILPFANMGANPDTEYLSDGLTESLINNLSRLSNLRVTARTTAFTFKGRSLDPRQAGRELGVDALLTGRVTQRGDTLSIQVDLINVADGSQLWGEHYQRKLSDILAVQSEIARAISAKMRLRLTGEEEQRLNERYTENVEAYQLYLQGRYFWNKVTEEAVKKSEGYFKEAIAKDPNYALAYVGLADTYILSSYIAMASPAESYGQAKVAVTKALELDDKLGDAHATLALVLSWYEWNWPAGEAEFKRAIELSPNSATAHQGYGRALTIVGRFDEALAELTRAHDLDPLSLIIDADLESVFFFSRRYDESIKQNRKILDMEARFVFAYIDLSTALEQTGKPQEAITELQKALSLEPENPFVLSLMGYDYARMGASGRAQDMIRQLSELSRRRYVSPMLIARVYAGLGNKDQAFASLEQGYLGRDYNLPYLRVDQTFASLRSDMRFSDLVRRIGLP